MYLFKRRVSDTEIYYIHRGGYVLTGVCCLGGWFVSRIAEELMNGFQLQGFSYIL